MRACRSAWFAMLLASVLAVGGLAACGDGGDGTSSTTTRPAASPQDFSARGPYAVGATRLQLDADRPVEVFYPADRETVPPDASGYQYTREDTFGTLAAIVPPDVFPTLEIPDAWLDVPASTDGEFPMVVVSHGFGRCASPTVSTPLTSHRGGTWWHFPSTRLGI